MVTAPSVQKSYPLNAFWQDLRSFDRRSSWQLEVWVAGGPVCVLLGQFAAELWIVLTGIAFLVRSAKKQTWAWVAQAWFLTALAFCLWAVVCGLLSIDPPNSSIKALTWIRFPLIAAALGVLLPEAPGRMSRFLTLMALCALVLAATLLVERGLNLNAPRLHGFYGRWNAAWYLRGLAFFPICVLLYYVARGNRIWSGASLLIFIYLTAIVATGELYVGASLLFGIGIFLILSRSLTKISILMLAAVILLVISLFAFNDALLERVITALTHRLPWSPESDYRNPMLAGLLLGGENELIGVGPEMFEDFCKTPEAIGILLQHGINQCNSHPHNLYIQYFSETGLPGIVLFIVLGGQLLYKGIQANQSSPQNPALCAAGLSAIIVYWWPISTYSNAFGAHMNQFTWFTIGIAIASFNLSLRQRM